MYEWTDIAQLVNELLNLVVKTCEARYDPTRLGIKISPWAFEVMNNFIFRSDAKLMAIRQKYTNKKFGRIAVVAQSKVALFNQMKSPEFATSSPH